MIGRGIARRSMSTVDRQGAVSAKKVRHKEEGVVERVGGDIEEEDRSRLLLVDDDHHHANKILLEKTTLWGGCIQREFSKHLAHMIHFHSVGAATTTVMKQALLCFPSILIYTNTNNIGAECQTFKPRLGLPGFHS